MAKKWPSANGRTILPLQSIMPLSTSTHRAILLVALLFTTSLWYACGSGFNQQQVASDFKTALDVLPDKKLKDTVVSTMQDSVRVLLANYIIPQDSLIEDIGFDQVEAQLLVMSNDKEVHRATIGVDWSRTQLNRTDMNFSPLVDFKLESVSDDGLNFRCMLVEYDQNKMHRLSYVVDALGNVSCSVLN